MDYCTTAFFFCRRAAVFLLTLFVWLLIMGRAVCIGEHWESQLELESLTVYDSEGAVAVVQLHQELRHLWLVW